MQLITLYLVTRFSGGSVDEAVLFREKECAINYARKLDEEFSEKDVRDVTEYGAIYDCDNPENEVACTRYVVSGEESHEKSFVLHISEDHGSGESYGGIHRVYAGSGGEMMDILMDWYDDEHNRSDASANERCRYCEKKTRKKCSQRFASRFSVTGYGEISNTHCATLLRIVDDLSACGGKRHAHCSQKRTLSVT
jgi:hypothetical protein